MSRKQDLTPFLTRFRPPTMERLAAYSDAHRISRAAVIEAAVNRFLDDEAPVGERVDRMVAQA